MAAKMMTIPQMMHMMEQARAHHLSLGSGELIKHIPKR